jgi:acetoin utilization protein AcuB
MVFAFIRTKNTRTFVHVVSELGEPARPTPGDHIVSPSPLRISQFMSPCPLCIEQDQPMSEAHRLMRNHRVRHLPVLSKGRLVGLVSSGDLRLLETLDDVEPERVSVEEAMTSEPYCVRPEALLDEVVDVMAGNKYGCALVVQAGRVEGIFTTVDALEAFAHFLRGQPTSAQRRGE